MIFYWFVHHIEGDNGQDIRHTLILGFSLLFRLLSFGYACPLCVLAKGETLLHRACKRNQVETVFKILALPGTDVNVQGKVLPRFAPSPPVTSAAPPPLQCTTPVRSGGLKSG